MKPQSTLPPGDYFMTEDFAREMGWLDGVDDSKLNAMERRPVSEPTPEERAKYDRS